MLPAFACRTGGEGKAPATRPNVVLVVVDTLRQDRLSCCGHPRRMTPHLDRLAAGGVLYAEATTVAPWTLPSHGSLLTGLLPSAHGSHWEHYSLNPSTPTLAELLRARGYRTFARCANPWLSPGNGYDRGFEKYELAVAWRRQIEATGDKGASATVERVFTWLDDPAGAGEPFFVFLNLMEPHLPYIPPPHYEEYF
jgi:arylsulfatase A-like enzyme